MCARVCVIQSSVNIMYYMCVAPVVSCPLHVARRSTLTIWQDRILSICSTCVISNSWSDCPFICVDNLLAGSCDGSMKYGAVLRDTFKCQEILTHRYGTFEFRACERCSHLYISNTDVQIESSRTQPKPKEKIYRCERCTLSPPHGYLRTRGACASEHCTVYKRRTCRYVNIRSM